MLAHNDRHRHTVMWFGAQDGSSSPMSSILKELQMKPALIDRLRPTFRIGLATLSSTAIATVLALAGGFPSGLQASGQEPVRPSAQAPHVPVAHLFTSAKSRTYTIRIEPESEDSDAGEIPAAAPAAEASAVGKATTPALGPEAFKGTDRKAAKLSIANSPIEEFSDLNDMIATLTPESAMTNHTPPITRGATSNRVAEEKRNVRVNCYLYAASQENDRDYHLILGRDPGATPETYMTMELSGLPPSSSPSFATLKAAREAFKSFFGPSQLPGPGYDFYDPPIPVVVEGSLFFNITHATGGRPGPQSLRPHMPVIWEVHPITKMEFEP